MPAARSRNTRTSRARPGGPVGVGGGSWGDRSTTARHSGRTSRALAARVSLPLASPGLLLDRMSARCSIDLMTIGVRSPKFLDGKQPNGTNCQGCPNPGTVASGALRQRFARPASRYPLSLGGHPGIYTPVSLSALRKCPYGAKTLWYRGAACGLR